MKLNLGSGEKELPGYVNLDAKFGDSIFPIRGQDEHYTDVEEIRASHVLEHFSFKQAEDVVRHWVDCLTPGGTLKIAVPDLEKIAWLYQSGQRHMLGGYLMGGQTDELDFHRSVFDRDLLADMMRRCGLVAIRGWSDSAEDCSSLPVSLNLAGTKPPETWPKVAAVISVPRLGFNDFWSCAYHELASLDISLRKTTGAYWDRDLAHGIEEVLASEDPEWILTCDYDTVFTRDQVQTLLDVARRFPHVDALAPLQTARHHGMPMMTVRQPNGEIAKTVAREEIERGEILAVETAHFGLTLLRADKLRRLPKPWFARTFAPDGGLKGEGAMDPDVSFWHRWKEAGHTAYVALRVPVGHCELMVRWPDLNLEATFQHPSEFHASGAPRNVWR